MTKVAPTPTICPYAYYQGRLVPLEKATVTVACHSLQYGLTCFGGIRGYLREKKSYALFRLRDHFFRLMDAAKIMGIPYKMEYAEFLSALTLLIQKNAPEGNFYIRPFIYSPTNRLAPRIPGLEFDLAIYLVPFASYFDPDVGLRLCISSWRKFQDIALPTKAKAGGCYVNSSMATTDALAAGYDEALMTDQDGLIVEGSVANLLAVRRGRILTPPRGAAQLEGITLRTILYFLEEEGQKVSFEPIDRGMIYTMDELMLLGTAAEITFASSVDGRIIGSFAKAEEAKPGPLCTLLREKYRAAIAGEHPKSREWVEVVSI